MTKSDLIDALATRTGMTKSRAEYVVNSIFDSMVTALGRGEGIEIRGFGSFSVKPRRSYAGRNPRTGESVSVPAKKQPRFKAGKDLRDLVNESRTFAISGGDDDDDADES